MGKCEVDVVAAQHQVIADGDASKARASRRFDDRDQAEVGCPSADIADQDQLAGAHLALPAVLVRDDPAVKRRLRFLQQSDRGKFRPFGGLDRQLAGCLVERGWHRQHDFLVFQALRRIILGKCLVPGVADVSQERGRGLDRRDFLDLGRASPGQNVGLAVDPGMAEPALGTTDQSARDLCPLQSGKFADDPVGSFAPWQPGRARRKLVIARQVQERRHHGPRCGLCRRNKLRHLEIANVGRWPLAAACVSTYAFLHAD